MRKNRLGVSVLFALVGTAFGLTAGFGLETESAIAQEYGACYMETSSGERINFDFCQKNPPIPKPKPKAKPSAAKPQQLSRSSAPAPNYPASVNLQAFLRLIRYAEGTDSDDGYRIQYTGTRFLSFADHPRIARCGYIKGGRVCSTAAGAYQFLESTWDDVASAIGAGDFSPAWQDRGAIELIERAGAMADVESGRIESAISKLAPIWASFPRWAGDGWGSYGQSVVSMGELVQEFRRQQQLQSSLQARR